MGTTDLGYLARELPVSERTLRRCAEGGLIRARREGPRRLSIPPREQRYVRRHWALLGALRGLLRCERNVRLAVLYGSVARGTEGPGSDVDILVSLRDPSIGRLAQLSGRLSDRLGHEVHLARLQDAERSPSILAEALDEGRVVIDRDGEWPRLMQREPEVQRRAEREERDLSERAALALDAVRARDGG